MITSEIQLLETKQDKTPLTNEFVDEKEFKNKKIQESNISDISDGYKKIQEFLALENKDKLSFHLVTKGKIPSSNELNISNSTLGFGHVFSGDFNVEYDLTGLGHINGYMVRLYPTPNGNNLDVQLTMVNLYSSFIESEFCVSYIQKKSC